MSDANADGRNDAGANDGEADLLPRLTATQARVLGCLIEKSRTTPDAYPLSVNSLRLACNQSTNRDPVVDYDDNEVDRALDGLRELGLARRLKNPGERAIKHRHVAGEAWGLDDAALAVVAVLLLRGAQTPGELKQRTERLHGFASLDQIEATLASLADRSMVESLARRAGQKESRWRQRFTALDDGAEAAERIAPQARGIPADRPVTEPMAATLAATDASGAVVRTLAVDTEREIDAKLARARSAATVWRAMESAQRATIVDAGLARIGDRVEALAALLPESVGLDPIELLDMVERARVRATDDRNPTGEADDAPATVTAFVFDARHTLAVDVLAAALAQGAAVVVKPAASAVLAGLAAVDEFHAAGMPADVMQCVVGDGATGAALVRAGADLVRFYGGHDAGWAAARVAGERNVAIDLRLR